MPTFTEHLPSLRALCADDDRLLAEELQLARTRRQIALVRALADELERCVRRASAAPELHDQLVQELAALGCSSIEAAAAIAQEDADPETSGVYPVLAPPGDGSD